MTEATGSFSHAEGEMGRAIGPGAHVEGAVYVKDVCIGTVEAVFATE
jgi:hypothetical protein